MNLRKNLPADGVVVDEEAEAGSRKKLFVAGGVAAALAVVAAMSYVVLTGGDDSGEASGVVAAAKRTAAAQPSQQPTATAKASAPAIKKFTGKNARDPFKALVVEQAAATSESTTAGTSGSTGSATSGTADTTTTVPGSGTDTTADAPKSASPVTITLVSVVSNDTAATFKLDAKSYKNVKPLSTFGTYFKLLNLREGKCGAVQYGDVTFDMCKGDSLTLR